MKNNNKKNSKNKIMHGYAILELIFYITFFAILSFVVINAMIVMTRSLKETSIQSELMQGGTIIEKISREVRASYDLNLVGTNDLNLSIKDVSGTNRTVEFLFSGSNVKFFENGIFVGNLNTPNISIVALNFSQINTTKSKAVKIFLTVKSNRDLLNRDYDFYDTLVLRGSY